jgi:UDP-glucose 4-epimerase
MRILVTGGAGFIGSNLVDALISSENRVAVIDNFSSGRQENINLKAKYYKIDLSDEKEVEKIFKLEEPEIVYHLAAQIDVRKSVENPVEDAKANILNTLKLLNLCVRYNVRHFIFSSTGGAIYGDSEIIPTPEGTLEKPVSPYGCAKLAVEKYLIFYNKTYGLKFTALRYSNVYGPRQNPKGEAGVISIFLDKMIRNETPIIFGGIQTRDFVFVEDVVNANILALKDVKSSIYNVGTGKETDIIEVFNKLNKYFGNKFEPKYEEMKKGEQKRSCLSFDKIKKRLDWKPRTGIDSGLDKTYCWFLKNLRKSL